MRIDLPLCRHYEYRDFCKWFSDGNCKLNISNCKAVCEKHIDEVVKQLEECSFYSEPTYDDDGYSNDDEDEVVDLWDAIEIVKKGGKNDI